MSSQVKVDVFLNVKLLQQGQQKVRVKGVSILVVTVSSALLTLRR